ncbi:MULTISPECIES: SDR family oxidoreductase [Streptomyces]|uniref:SDR family oxidoreductase n=1 Tax=Streptomyces herbicida TaxID=3065675 RepID=UPI0038CD57E5
MTDRCLSFTGTAPGRFPARRLGLPQPARLWRRTAQTPSPTGPLLQLTAGKSDLDLAPVLARTGLAPGRDDPAAVVLDATRVRDLDTLAEVHSVPRPVVRSVAESGRVLVLDITAADAGERVAAALPDGPDVLVHNAGATRDRRLVNMSVHQWSSVLEATASIAGLADNAGQTNHGAGKAGTAGLVRSLAPHAVAGHGVTVNAVAPGFIETRMTAAIPLLIREAGHRMNSPAQGGRVRGQSLPGA